jgi:hypothetical protein
LSLKVSKFLSRVPYQSGINLKTNRLDKVAPFLQPQMSLLLSISQERVREVRRMKSEYDLHSAVTFLLVGLGVGSFLAIVFNPKQRVAPEGIKGISSWRTPGRPLQEDLKKRVA